MEMVRERKGVSMLTIVTSPKRVGYGFDTDFHSWREILEMYPNCSILCTDVKRDYELQYPPVGCRVFGWNKDDNFYIGDVDGEGDIERFHALFDGIDNGHIEEINTRYRTKEEFVHQFDGFFAFGEYVEPDDNFKIVENKEGR